MSSKLINNFLKSIKNANQAKFIANLDWKELEDIIEECRYAYVNKEEPLISDNLYDILISKLRIIKPNSKLLKGTGSAPPNSTQNKEVLQYFMSSITEKTKGTKENDKFLSKFLKKYPGPFVLSDKEDGISCLVIMSQVNSKKINIEFFSKGDGINGRRITFLKNYINTQIDVNLFNDLLTKFKKNKKWLSENRFKNDIVLRGELIMKRDIFEKYFSKKSKSKFDKFTSARSAVNGVTLRKEDNIDYERAKNIDLLFYEIIQPSGFTISEQYDLLNKWNLNTPEHIIVDSDELEEESFLENYFDERKENSEYDIDGIVIADDSTFYERTDQNPDHMIAFKGKSTVFETTVNEVIWEASKDGLLKPICLYEEIQTKDADLVRVTLHNARFVLINKVSPGAVILIMRSGETIPAFIGTVKSGKGPYLPEEFNNKNYNDNLRNSKEKNDWSWEWNENKIEIVLINPENNYDVKVKRLVHFCKTIGAKNWAEGILTNLVYNHNKTNIQSLIKLKSDYLSSLKGFKNVLAKKLIRSLHNSLKKTNIIKIMVGSNCFGGGFGIKKITKIMKKYPKIIYNFQYTFEDEEEGDEGEEGEEGNKEQEVNKDDSDEEEDDEEGEEEEDEEDQDEKDNQSNNVFENSFSDNENDIEKDNYHYWYEKIINIYGFEQKTTEKFLEKLPDFIEFLNNDFIPAINYSKIIIPGINDQDEDEEGDEKGDEDDQGEKRERNNQKDKKNKSKKENIIPEFENKSIVFTNVRDKDVEDLIERSGGNVVSRVSGKTYLLIYGSLNSSINLNKANELGIPKMSLDEFKKKYM